VEACSHLIAKLLLQGLAGQRVVGDRAADLPLDRLHRRWAVCGDHFRCLDRPPHQLALRHQPVYQTEPSRLRGIDQSRRQE